MTTYSTEEIIKVSDIWSTAPSEHRDFYHRIRAFPKLVASWRKERVAAILRAPGIYSGVPNGAKEVAVRELLDEGITYLREIDRMLSLLYSQLPKSQHFTPEAWRVLDRLKPYRKLGLPEVAARAEDASTVWATFLPPMLDNSLADGLAHHAQAVCHEQAPQCGGCALRRFCGTWRATRQAEAASVTNQPTVIDLFCGAGGSSTGFAAAGYRVLGSLDWNEAALKTYWLNHPEVPDDQVICGDIRKVPASTFAAWTGGRRLDVLAGSPPCQGFSHIGDRSKRSRNAYELVEDDRNHLFKSMFELVRALRPKLVLMENVPGMQSAKVQDQSYLEQAAQMLESEGYKTVVWRLNAATYGVPQDRTRMFLVASDLGCLPGIPEPEYHHDPSVNLRAYFDELLPPITFDEATYDLPPRLPDSGEVIEPWISPADPKDRSFKRYHRKAGIRGELGWLFNHTARFHNADDLDIYANLRPGEDSVHFVERAAEHGKRSAMKYRVDIFDDKYARLRPDRPSKTIVAHLARDGNGFVHPHQVRSITPREAARLQSFPDDYAFCGAPSDQWVQIGNAVPPVLARAIARSFAALLERYPT